METMTTVNPPQLTRPRKKTDMSGFVSLALVFYAFASYGQPAGLSNKKDMPIICLTYDDALDSQLSAAIPQLDSAGIKGTFFLNSLQGTSGLLGKGSPAFYGWRKASQNGHELANHTLFHACPEKFGWKKEEAIESYTVDEVLKEIEVMNVYLEQIDQKRIQRTFAFPCNNVMVDGVDYSKRLQERGLVSYARGGGDQQSVVAELHKMNVMQVPSWHVQEGTGLDELIEFAEKVKSASGLGVFQFHDIGGPLFKISSETHRAFLKYLSDHKTDYLIVTFADAMGIIQERNELRKGKK